MRKKKKHQDWICEFISQTPEETSVRNILLQNSMSNAETHTPYATLMQMLRFPNREMQESQASENWLIGELWLWPRYLVPVRESHPSAKYK